MADEHDDAMAWAEAEADKIADKDIKTRPFSELRAKVMAKRKAEAEFEELLETANQHQARTDKSQAKLLEERDQLASYADGLREALEPFALAFEGAGDDFDPCTITIALGEPRRALKALNVTPPQALAARDGEVLAYKDALQAVIAYDHHGRLIAAKDGDTDRSQSVIFAGEVEELDRLYDVMLAATQAALTNSKQAAKDAEDRIRAKALEDAYNALFVLPAASIEQEQMAQRCQAAIRAMKGGE